MRRLAAVIVLSFLPPLPALAGGFGNKPPAVDALSVSPTPAPAGASATITCSATDTDGQVVKLELTVTGGAVEGGAATGLAAITPGATVQGSITWTTPAAGSYDVTCAAWDNGGAFGGSAVGRRTINVVVAPLAPPPVVDALDADQREVLGSTLVEVVAAAHDPAGGTLTYAWSASGGSVAGQGARARWTAPDAPGLYAITLRVVNATGSEAAASVQVAVVLKFHVGSHPLVTQAPRRIVAGAAGELLVVDALSGSLLVLTPRGELRDVVRLEEPVEGAVACGAQVVVATRSGRLLTLDPGSLRPTGELALAGGPLAGAGGLACDRRRGLVFAAERRAAQVRAVAPDGSTSFVLSTTGTGPLEAPVDVAVDAEGGLVWVLQAGAVAGPLVHAYTLDGAWVRSTALFGGGVGRVTRGGGIGVGVGGTVYVADAFQGLVQVFARDGTAVGQLGAFGAGDGQLRQPSGLAPLGNGDLLVANLDAGRIERFGIGAALPTCAGDADCDGLPDAWELAHGLNPFDPRDANADPDGDGLGNRAEFAAGTDPHRLDSDGDGTTDGGRVLTAAVLSVGSAIQTDPGLVRLVAALEAPGPCRVGWEQLDGPLVKLRDGASLHPSFIARKAATYRFRGTPQCAADRVVAGEAVVTVRAVAPRVDPGHFKALRPGQWALLDGRDSSDANGGTLSYTWEQPKGPVAIGTERGAAVWAKSLEPGLLTFSLEARDDTGFVSRAEVQALVVKGGQPVPAALAQTPVEARVGDRVTLDASDSVGGPGLTWHWRQVAGAPVRLWSRRAARPSFVPAAAGRYAFEVEVFDTANRSPPQLVEVYVAARNTLLPVARASAPAQARVNEPVALDGQSSAGSTRAGLSYHWRVVTGRAAGLTGANEAVATLVPFEAGTYELELEVSEAGVPGVPARVRVDAEAPVSARPVARAQGPGLSGVGRLVKLDGSVDPHSVPDGTRPLHYRWTQVGGPWVVLDDYHAPLTTFVPAAAGLYSFQLEVDDGGTRSAPASVGVLVFAKQAGGTP